MLTAIVIAMAMTIYLFAAMAALARRGKRMDVEPVPDDEDHVAETAPSDPEDDRQAES